MLAQFRDAAGNESSVMSDSIVLDTQAPSGSISINSGASTTASLSVTLSLSASGATEMRVSNSSSFSGSSWETYSSTKSWTLSSGDGTKTVYARFRDSAGNESSAVSDSILLYEGMDKGDVNNDGKVRSNDAILALRIAAGLMTLTDYQVADVNGDGEIKSNDAILILRAVTGLLDLDTGSVMGTAEGTQVSIREFYADPGSTITIEINVDDVTGIAGGDVVLEYNPDILEAKEARSTALIAGLMIVPNTGAQGKVTAGMAGITGLSGGSGTILEVDFEVKSRISGDSSLAMSYVMYDELGNRMPYTGNVSVSVAVPEPLPERIISLPSISTEPGSTATVEISIDDATGIAGGDIELEYDPAVLELTAVRPANLITDFSVAAKTDLPGKVQIAMAARTGLAGGEGAMLEIDFQVKVSASGESALILSDVSLFDEMGMNIDTTVINGSVMVRSVSDDMVLIPAGEFSMGDAFNEGESDELPVHTVYLDAFYMDKYEVTNAQYAAFLNQYGKNTDASGNELLNIDDSYIHKVGGSYRATSGDDNHPVVQVSWYGAKAYAEFYGKRLPTEAEWEKAARGGLAGKRYPWGDSISHDDTNYSGTGGRDVWGATSPVGSFAPYGYGLYDMAGNVWEWCADWYDSSYYANSPSSAPQGPGSGTYRVLRGGGWYDDPEFLRVAGRGVDPAFTSHVNGFRCVSQD